MAETKQKDAIALLKDDHRTVEELFAQFEKASGEGRKQKLARQICLELSVHAAIEEEIFYPACEGKVDEELLKEAYVEHDGAKVLIAEIEAGDGQSDDYFDAKVKVLQEQIEHHVQEEERPAEGMFAQCRKTEIDLVELRDRMLARKQELIEHHVEEEEKRMEGLFSQARKAGLDMDALGEQLAQRKAELVETYKTTGLPKPELTTMNETL